AMEVLMAFTGMRREEVRELRNSDLENNLVRILGKRKKERKVPLTPEFWEAMKPYLDWKTEQRSSSDHFVLHKDANRPKLPARPYALSSISQAVTIHGLELGLDISPHTLRRTFGRRLWKNGCPIEMVKELLGHSSVQTTILYLGINQYDIEDAAQYIPRYRK
ncbi:MAG: site-specific integrase, partial [Euryarchaeota archaeon]|nr:site-specific integrase [Euryarchaeota archaeon]